ncbi:MAG TPA: hypothetical protein VFH16_16835 [Rubrobacter sp.]|nr:hypothetical protein [Rubrobacter sp.]
MVGKWRRDGYFWKRRISSETCTIQDMDIQNRELWDRLENEPERAYRAFECFLNLPSGERTLLAAYRQHVGNPDAVKPSDTWSGWSSQFAWRERAAAYDDHLASLRREAYERAIEEEAERQAREVEKARGHYNELMTAAYLRAMERLEDDDWVSRNLRSSDVLNITRLYMDAVKAFEVDRESKVEDDWEEDDEEFDEIVKEIDAQANPKRPEGEEEDGEDSENTESDLI